MTKPYLLAIDTSCDDTAAAVTAGRVVVSNVVASQTQLHKKYGGVFPTVAKQAHRENVGPVIQAALQKAKIQWVDLAAIAVTQGPGLAPALEVGIEKAKELAVQHNLPLIPVNHIEGHVLSSLATRAPHRLDIAKTVIDLQLPALVIVVSGGHTEFVLVKKIGDYEILGKTVDDAAGEALDKFGRMVDLGYPAGPVIEQFAQHGDAQRYPFPLPMTTSGNANLSFSGLKTSARTFTEKLQADHTLTKQEIYDLCASFQYSVFRAITYKLNKLLPSLLLEHQIFGVWLGGGVAANNTLRQAIRQTIRPYHLHLSVPYSKKLCIDNAAMIGVAAGYKLERGEVVRGAEIQSVERIPRWEI